MFKKLIITCALALMASSAMAYEYCSGTVQSITARTSAEATYLTLNLDTGGRSSAARIGGGDKYLDRLAVTKKIDDNQAVQIDLIIAAYLNGKKVFLELDTNGYYFNSCSDFEIGTPVRYVKLGS